MENSNVVLPTYGGRFPSSTNANVRRPSCWLLAIMYVTVVVSDKGDRRCGVVRPTG